ncbi:MAG: RlmE family RNA methyltransferase [Hyphomicrobium sp.]
MAKKTQGSEGWAGKKKSISSESSKPRMLHVHVKSATKKSHSSIRWLERQLNDPYVVAAKREGYRSRAAYKLLEIDNKYHLFKPGLRVVDLGAAPGGWSQIAAERVKSAEGKGQVVALDYLTMEPLAGVEFLQLDFLIETAEDQLKKILKKNKAEVVLSDMAAPTIGHAKTDHLRIMGLAESAAFFACGILETGGSFLCKVLQGGTEKELLNILKGSFKSVRHVKPPASRSDSAELYVLATNFKGVSNSFNSTSSA